MNVMIPSKNWADQMRKALDPNIRFISNYVYETFTKIGWPHYTADQWIEPIGWFLNDNFDKTPYELEYMASTLSPGGAHDSGLLVIIVKDDISCACPILLAATIAYNWKGGKIGFQFLPDPAVTEFDEYEDAVWDLVERLKAVNPTTVLTGEDRAFYDSLPDRFVVYRGCHGITAKQAASGLCWTRNRAVAEWFAGRGNFGIPVLVSAWVRKKDVLLSFASEFEIVVQPRYSRELKSKTISLKFKPEFSWRNPDNEPGHSK